jgi:hypothetical protein
VLIAALMAAAAANPAFADPLADANSADRLFRTVR